MAISFNSIPSTLRIPFVAVEFDASQAQQGDAILPYDALHIGQRLSTGTWAANSINRATNVDQVIGGAGRGSIAHRQAIGWFASNKSTAALFGVVDDNGAGVAATGTILFTAAATASGTIAFYFGGVLVSVGVTAGDATTALATNTAAAINAATDLPITASVVGSTVTMLFRHKGLVGNTYDVRTGFNGEELPAGVDMTITAMGGVVAGTTNPTLTSLIAAMGDIWFQIWSHPYTDATSLTAIENELASRLGPLRSIDGVAITSISGSFATHTTLGAARNSGSSVIIAQPGSAPLTPPMEFAAETAALVAKAGEIDPARPFTTLQYTNAVSTGISNQWTSEERELFLHGGIATSRLGPGGAVQIDRVITTYQTSPAGSPDTAYLDATTGLTLLYLRFDFRTYWASKYSRHKLANDGTRFGSGQAIMTPLQAKGEAVGWFIRKEKQGLVEDVDQFKRDLVVERNASDPNRLDFLLPPNLINQLIVTAAKIQFRL
jgi:phage tail sheath gpL-like